MKFLSLCSFEKGILWNRMALSFLLIIMLFLNSWAIEAIEWPEGWSEVTTLYSVSINSSTIGLAIDDKAIILSWIEGGRMNGELYFQRLLIDEKPPKPTLLGEGEFFSNPALLFDDQGYSHIVWEGRQEGREVIYYTRVDPRGEIVEPRALLTSPYLIGHVDLIKDGDELYLLWSGRDEETMNFDIFMMPFTTSGDSIEPPVNLTRTPLISGRSRAIILRGEIHLLWMDYVSDRYHIYYQPFSLKGEPLKESLHLDTVYNIGSRDRPALLAGAKGDLHLLWNGDSSALGLLPVASGLTYMQLRDGEIVNRERILEGHSTIQRPTMARINDKNLGVLWQDNRRGPLQVHYLELEEGGDVLKGPIPLDITSRASHAPKMVVDENEHQYVFWLSFDDEGRDYQLSMIHTRSVALPSIWYKMGLHPQHPLPNLLFVLLANLLLSLIITLIHPWIYLLPLLLFSLLERRGLLEDIEERRYQALFLLFAFLFLIQGFYAFIEPIGASFSFHGVGAILSSLVTILFLRSLKHFSLASTMNRLVLILLWLYWFHYFIYIPQVMEWL